MLFRSCNFVLPCFFSARIQEGKHSQEIGLFQAELAEARTQLQLLQKQLDEQLNRQPAGNQEVTFREALRLQGAGLMEPGGGPTKLDSADGRFTRSFLRSLCAWKGYLLFINMILTHRCS